MKRDISKKMIFGVCAGLAKDLNIDIVLVRAVFLITSLLGFGMPVIIYLILAILMPAE